MRSWLLREPGRAVKAGVGALVVFGLALSITVTMLLGGVGSTAAPAPAPAGRPPTTVGPLPGGGTVPTSGSNPVGNSIRATNTAEQFLGVWLTPGPGWVERARPYATDRFLVGVATTDPANVPKGATVRSARPELVTEQVVTVLADLSTGKQLVVTLVPAPPARQAVSGPNGWLVDDLRPPGS